MEKLYKITEVAQYFKVSKQTVHNWIQAGKLKTSATPGGELRVLESEIQNIVKKVK